MSKPIYLGTTNSTTNPRDPYVFYLDNYYYHLFSKNNALYIKKASTLEELESTVSIQIYKDEKYKEVWAPELHIINDICYIYVAMDDGDNFNHRMYVLTNNSNNPLDKFTLHNKIETNPDRWAIDGSLLKYNGKTYFIWSGWEGFENVSQNIYIQEMKDPFTLIGERALISTPEYEWEKFGCEGKNNRPFINEGPFAIYGTNNIHIVYSGSGSWSDDYCLGLLTFKGGDIMNKENWIKKANPILKRTPTALGPGHASFFDDPETNKKYVTYHVFNKDCSKGWDDTHAIIQEYKMIDDYPVLEKAVNYFLDK